MKKQILLLIFVGCCVTAFSQSISDDFKKAAQGDAEAMYNLGMNYLKGIDVNRDRRVAEQWFEKSAKKGNTKAMTQLGIICNDEGRISEAIKWLEKSTDKGDIEAPFYLAIRYDFDNDSKKAFHYYELSSTRGYLPAMSRLAWCYYENLGILDRNHYEIALKWANKAADLGNTEAMYLLYRIYDDPKSGVRDSHKSREWLEKAANNNNARACYELAATYEYEGAFEKAWEYYGRCEEASFEDPTKYFKQYGSTHYPADALSRQRELERDHSELRNKQQP